MKTLYLHIGTPKTATTSIQSFCVDNQKLLQKKGFCYPLFPYRFPPAKQVRNGHFLVGKCFDSEGRRNLHEENRIFHEGMDTIKTLFREYDNVVLSDEGIWTGTCCDKADVWPMIKEEADKGGFAVKVIVYLRRQDEYISSWWNQKVKMGRRKYATTPWEQFIHEPIPESGLNYYEILQRISDGIGKENVIPRQFGRQYFPNQSIYEDFFEALGLEFTDEYVITESQRNESLFGNSIEIKRILNSLPNLGVKDNILFRNAIIEASAAKPENKKIGLFTEDEAKEFQKQFDDINRKVMKEYKGEDGDFFDQKFKKAIKWTPQYNEKEEELIIFMGNLAMELRKENEALKKRLDLQEKELKRQKHLIENLKTKLKHPIKTVLNRTGK